jgi:hypothetical protein
MTTVASKKTDLSGMTVNEIKTAYPNGVYKSSMRKNEVIEAALKTVKQPATGTSYGRSVEH